MNVLIIALAPNWNKNFWYNFGIAYILAVLKKNGVKTELLILDKNSVKTLDSYSYIKNKFDIIGVSFSSNQLNSADILFSWLNDIKKNTRTHIISAGIHPTLSPETEIKREAVDAVFIGESETAIIDYINNYSTILLSETTFPNIVIKTKNKIIFPDKINRITNLDSLPFADRDSFNYVEHLKQHHILSILAGRGCYYSCTYCNSDILKQIYTNSAKYVQMRSPENIIDEICELIEKYHPHIHVIQFFDDVFTHNFQWLKEFCELYKKKIKIPFWCNGRVNLITEDLLKILKNANCQKILMGIESGDYNIRKKMLNRDMSNWKIIKSFRLAKKNGLKTYSHNIIGIPGENFLLIYKTLILNILAGVDEHQITKLYPYPKTKIYDYCVKNNYITEYSSDHWNDEFVLDIPCISREELQYYYQNFSVCFNNILLALFFPKYKCESSFIHSMRKDIFELLQQIFK